MTDRQFSLAAVRFGDGDPIDDLLETVVRRLQAGGHRLAGYLQRETPDGPGCCSIMHLEDISSGSTVRISQALGAGSRGCRLDPRALAELSGRLLSEINGATELVVLNRFGKGESDGQGLRRVIEHACELGVPVLTAVRDTYRPAWTDFTGGFGEELRPDWREVLDWAAAAIADRTYSRADLSGTSSFQLRHERM